MSLREHPARGFGKGFGLLAMAFILFIAVVAMLAEVGLPEYAAAILFALATLVTFIAIGVFARTMNLPDFLVASREVPPAFNGMATAAAFLSSAGFLGLAAAFFAGNGTVLAVIAGWTIGFLALSILIAPYFRKAAAVTVADFLAVRFDSPAVRFAAVVVTLASCFGFLVAEMNAAGLVVANFIGISSEMGIVIAFVVMVAGSLLGGMRSVTLIAIAQYIVIAIAFLAPVALISLYDYDLPIPQLTYGYALEEIAVLGGNPVAITGSRLLPLPSLDGFNMVVLALSLAAGVASMPHVLMRVGTSVGIRGAGRSAGWALLFIFVIVATAPAYAAFAHVALLGGRSVGPFEADAVVLALPTIADLSPAMTALIAAGALAAILATATALLFAIAATIGHDLFSGLLDRHGPPARRLITTRVAVIVVASLAGWYATGATDDIFALAATSLSLAASGLFPALFLGIWWKRTTALGTLAGIVLGFAAAAAYVFMILYGGMAPWQPLGSAGTGLPAMAAAFFGIPVGILTIIFVSQITAEPSEEQCMLVEAIRQPTPSPMFDDRSV